MDTSRLPLLELFTSLQKAGLPLGLGEYQLLLQALQGGFGTADEAALKRLCQTLWVKSAAEQRIFEPQFERVMEDAIASTQAHPAKPEREPRTPASRIVGESETPSGSRSRGSETPAGMQKLWGRWPWLLAGVVVFASVSGGAVVWRGQSPDTSITGLTKATINQEILPNKHKELEKATQIASEQRANLEKGKADLEAIKNEGKSNRSSVEKLEVEIFNTELIVSDSEAALEELKAEIAQIESQVEATSASRLFYTNTLLLLLFLGVTSIGIWKLRQRSEQQRKAQEAAQAQPPIDPALAQTIGDEIQAAQTVSQVLRSARSSQPALVTQQVFAEDYLPIKQRQMKQCWRYLRLNRREGASTEVDVDATIRQVGRRGAFLDPVMVPRRVNRMELLLLVDQGGSMVPFHGLSRRLIETAVGSGRLGRSGVFYFRNLPGRSLYHDPYQIQAVKRDRVLDQCLPRWTTVMIVSDGGALRGGYNSRRLCRTRGFLEQLQGRVRSLVWLNPMPQERWAGTTAEGIAERVPMVEMSREGMVEAIGILRGREANHGF